jgi:hypothetical protein
MFTTCTGSQYHACHAISVHFLRRFWWRHLIIPFWKSLTVPSGGELRWPQPPTILVPHILLWFGQKLIHAMAMAMALPWIKTIFELRFWSTLYNGEQKKYTPKPSSCMCLCFSDNNCGTSARRIYAMELSMSCKLFLMLLMSYDQNLVPK